MFSRLLGRLRRALRPNSGTRQQLGARRSSCQPACRASSDGGARPLSRPAICVAAINPSCQQRTWMPLHEKGEIVLSN
jgi:hypothetical protein